MSGRPGKDQGEGQGKDKKKKFAPPSENELAKQQYMELDEEEIEHRRQLDMKYRDRAKERREGALAGEDPDFDNFDDENLVVQDGDREHYTTTKGLDFDLFIKEKEKERAELLAAKDTGKMLIENTAVGDDKTKISSKKIVTKTNLGTNIQRVLFKESKREGQRNIFKSGNCYEFDIDLNFGSNLPKLVIRSREKNLEEEPISVQISDRIHEKLGKIMTYIKTGKKPEPKKDVTTESQFQKAVAGKVNPISTQNMNDESDEDDIFPDAKKQLKTENGPKPAGVIAPREVLDERNNVMMKGLFSSLKPHGEDSIEIETEDQTTLYNKMIQEKNKKLIAELAQKRAEEKLAQLQAKDNDYYTECFPEEAPELEALKSSQQKADARGPGGKSNKSKKKALGKQFDQVSKAMDEKRKSGRGGD